MLALAAFNALTHSSQGWLRGPFGGERHQHDSAGKLWQRHSGAVCMAPGAALPRVGMELRRGHVCYRVVSDRGKQSSIRRAMEPDSGELVPIRLAASLREWSMGRILDSPITLCWLGHGVLEGFVNRASSLFREPRRQVGPAARDHHKTHLETMVTRGASEPGGSAGGHSGEHHWA